MEHFSKYAPITRKCPNTAITRCKQLQVIELVLSCWCGMWAIEEAFAKIKGILRRVGARTKDALVEALGEALSAVSAQDAQGYFEHAGYRPRVQLL
jgi:hypothetical protein